MKIRRELLLAVVLALPSCDKPPPPPPTGLDVVIASAPSNLGAVSFGVSGTGIESVVKGQGADTAFLSVTSDGGSASILAFGHLLPGAVIAHLNVGNASKPFTVALRDAALLVDNYREDTSGVALKLVEVP